MIAQFCEKNHQDWDLHLSDLKFALNTSRHESSGYTPAFLNFVRELTVPKILRQEVEEELPASDSETTDQKVPEHFVKRLEKLQECYELLLGTVDACVFLVLLILFIISSFYNNMALTKTTLVRLKL